MEKVGKEGVITVAVSIFSFLLIFMIVKFDTVRNCLFMISKFVGWEYFG